MSISKTLRQGLTALATTAALCTAVPASAGIVGFTPTVAQDETYASRFLVNIGLDDFRPVGSYTLNQSFSIGGAHWMVSGVISFQASTGFTSELLTISGTYVHLTNPDPGETSNSYSFSGSFNAWDVAKDAAGNPDFAGTKSGTLFNVDDNHATGPHDDTFKANYILGASNLIDANGPKYFDSVFFDFTSSHPVPAVPLPATLPLILAALGGLGLVARRTAA